MKKIYNNEIKYIYWEQMLSHLKDTKLNCLDLGADNGDNAKWLLNNICKNKDSKIYSINNWTDDNIFTKFTKNIESTNKTHHNIIINDKIFKTLINLIQKNEIKFDIIIINTDNNGLDILTNTILAWNLLIEDGILIFDEYDIKQVGVKYDNQIKALDSFISIFEVQLKVLYSGYQYIVQKIYNKSNIYTKQFVSYNSLLEKLNKVIKINKCDKFKYIIDEKINKNIDFKLKIKNKPLFLNNKIKNKLELIQELFMKIYTNKYYKELYIHFKIYDNKYFQEILDNKTKIFITIYDKLQFLIIYDKLVKCKQNDNVLIISSKKYTAEYAKSIIKSFNINTKLNYKLYNTYYYENNSDINNIYIKIINKNIKYDLIFFNRYIFIGHNTLYSDKIYSNNKFGLFNNY